MTSLWALGQMEVPPCPRCPPSSPSSPIPRLRTRSKKAAELVIDSIEGRTKEKTKEKSKDKTKEKTKTGD